MTATETASANRLREATVFCGTRSAPDRDRIDPCRPSVPLHVPQARVSGLRNLRELVSCARQVAERKRDHPAPGPAHHVADPVLVVTPAQGEYIRELRLVATALDAILVTSGTGIDAVVVEGGADREQRREPAGERTDRRRAPHEIDHHGSVHRGVEREALPPMPGHAIGLVLESKSYGC